MKSLTPSERRNKAMLISASVLITTLVIFLSYLLAVQHRIQRMQDIFYGSKDTVSVASTTYRDTADTVIETMEGSSATDEIVVGTIDKILRNITVFETVTYFLIVLCIISLVYFILSTVREWLMNRRKSSFAELSAQQAKILNEDLLDPVGLCEVIDKRIRQARNKSNKSDLFALDYLYLSRTSIIKPRTKSAYQKAFLEPFISNSQFSDKVTDIEDILDNKGLPDPLNYREKYYELNDVFKRFAVVRKNLTAEDTGNSSEDDRKSE